MLYFSSVLAVIPLHTSLNWISLQIHVSNFWNRFSTVSVLMKYPDQTNYQMWDFPWPQRICLETVSDSSRRFNRFFLFQRAFRHWREIHPLLCIWMLGYCVVSCCEKAEVSFPVRLTCRFSSAIHPSGICKRVVGAVINHLSLHCLERADDRSALHIVMPPDTTGIFCFILIKWIICRLLQKMTIRFYFYFFFQNWFYSCYFFKVSAWK